MIAPRIRRALAKVGLQIELRRIGRHAVPFIVRAQLGKFPSSQKVRS